MFFSIDTMEGWFKCHISIPLFKAWSFYQIHESQCFHASFKIYNSMIKSILSSILQLYVKYLKNALLTAGISLIFKLPWKVLYCFALVSAEMLQSKFALETNICSLYFFNFAFYKNMQMCNMFYANKAGNISS